MTPRQQKITLGEMRAGRGGARSLLVSCLNPRCRHTVRIAPAEAEKWPDDVRLSDLEPKLICTKCGHRGADVRPDFNPPKMGTGGN